MPKINYSRLLKLAKHLETGKLGHKKFDFSVFNANFTTNIGHNTHINVCGTNGCAIGECPIIFPKDWTFRDYGVVSLLNDRLNPHSTPFEIAIKSAKKFFGVTRYQFDHLFNPDGQTPYVFGGKNLSRLASKKEVAANIRDFVKVMKAKDKKASSK